MNDTAHDDADRDITRRAKRRVDMKLGFLTHLLVYVCVNAGLFLISNLHFGHRWNPWPLLGWGIGLAIHGLVTFISLRGEGMRERMLAAEVERLKRRHAGG